MKNTIKYTNGKCYICGSIIKDGIICHDCKIKYTLEATSVSTKDYYNNYIFYYNQLLNNPAKDSLIKYESYLLIYYLICHDYFVLVFKMNCKEMEYFIFKLLITSLQDLKNGKDLVMYIYRTLSFLFESDEHEMISYITPVKYDYEECKNVLLDIPKEYLRAIKMLICVLLAPLNEAFSMKERFEWIFNI